ncbi:MAG TPA: hypothetical protein VK654_14010 [Nitrospirota bacterium]|nr:hypothetical protein [Nitrospirota bacterium]
MNIGERLEKQPKAYHVAISILCALVIGVLDYGAGFEIRMEIFYLVPISYATWFVGKKTGIVLSFLPPVIILGSDLLSGKGYALFPVKIWNIVMYFAFFILVTLLLHQLRVTLQQRDIFINKMQNALNAVRELSGILPICANCKKIRDDEGYWHDVDVYIANHTKAEFTHGMCAECAAKLYPSLFDKIEK